MLPIVANYIPAVIYVLQGITKKLLVALGTHLTPLAFIQKSHCSFIQLLLFLAHTWLSFILEGFFNVFPFTVM